MTLKPPFKIHKNTDNYMTEGNWKYKNKMGDAQKEKKIKGYYGN
jgi:hypothetical protein